MLASYTVISKQNESLVGEVIIDSITTDAFFINCAYFSAHKEYHHKFSTGSAETFTAYRYRHLQLYLAHQDSSEVSSTIKKVNWALLLEHILINTFSLARKSVAVFLWQPHIPSKICYQRSLFEWADIINNKYVVQTTGYFPNSSLYQKIINIVYPIPIQTWHPWKRDLRY